MQPIICLACAGIFALVPLRRLFILRFRLNYPSGTATGTVINSFHTPLGEAKAKYGPHSGWRVLENSWVGVCGRMSKFAEIYYMIAAQLIGTFLAVSSHKLHSGCTNPGEPRVACIAAFQPARNFRPCYQILVLFLSMHVANKKSIIKKSKATILYAVAFLPSKAVC